MEAALNKGSAAGRKKEKQYKMGSARCTQPEIAAQPHRVL